MARIACKGEVYTDLVEIPLVDGTKPPDPAGVFNASLDAGTPHAIDLREGEAVGAGAFVAMVGSVQVSTLR